MKAGLLPVRPYWWQKVVILAHITHEGSRTINGKRLCALIASWSRGAPTEVWSQLCYVWDKQLMRDLTISLGRTEAESINLLFSAFETRVQIRLPFAQTIHGAVRNGFAFSPVPLPVSGTDFSSLSVSTSMSSTTLLIVQNSSKTCLDLLFISKCKFCSYSLQLWKLQCHVTKCGLFYSQWFSQILSIPLLPAILAHAKLSQSMLNSEYFFFNVFFFFEGLQNMSSCTVFLKQSREGLSGCAGCKTSCWPLKRNELDADLFASCSWNHNNLLGWKMRHWRNLEI